MKRINLYPFKLFSSHSKLNKTSFFPQRNSQYCLVDTENLILIYRCQRKCHDLNSTLEFNGPKVRNGQMEIKHSSEKLQYPVARQRESASMTCAFNTFL